MQVGKETIVCGTLYRSPVDLVKAHIDFRLQPIECLEKLDAKRKCYIFGDFNYDLAKSNENTHVGDFTEAMLNHNFCSIINKPTRITDTSATVLDHIWTNAYTDHINLELFCILRQTTCLYLCALIKVKLLLQISLLEALMMLI